MEVRILKVGFIGAGGVNFGGLEGPWDHASRLEQYCSDSACVTAIVEPDVRRAATVLAQRRSNSKYAHMYAATKVYPTLDDLLIDSEDFIPDAVFIGLPPLYHGSTHSPFDVEIRLARAGIHMFVEKPLSCHSTEEVQKVQKIIANAKAKDGRNLIVSVGYMFRYSAAVRKMQEILKEHSNGRVLSTLARYNCTYTSIKKTSWWDVTCSGGPIVEQATHFCDLSRLFGGDVDLDSVHSVCVGPTEEIAQLDNIPVDENTIKPENRVPRSTSAIWKYKSGAVGTLNHGLLLEGSRYMAEFEVWGVGVRLVLVDPYSECKLIVRTADSDQERIASFEDEDMYLNEMKAFIDAINANDDSSIESPYADAFNTYALSWKIAHTSSQSQSQSPNPPSSFKTRESHPHPLAVGH